MRIGIHQWYRIKETDKYMYVQFIFYKRTKAIHLRKYSHAWTYMGKKNSTSYLKQKLTQN
jgi:hypothetical protein